MLSQTTEYALRAMAALALSPERLVPTTFLASQTKVPPNYLAKVLQHLAAAGLITGRRGVGGGYRLKRGASEIRLLEVVNAIGELRRLEGCSSEQPEYAAGTLCALHRKTDEAIASVIRVFSSATLQDLLDDSGAPGPLCTASASKTPDLSMAKS
jgi:Rrf2 family transcriptional regulator, nitric oxide-sensitive transcriptional repressor